MMETQSGTRDHGLSPLPILLTGIDGIRDDVLQAAQV